ncbi:MAG: hypothetical protein JXK16_05990 [Thiotrichales bacterium]|nr:hypothetical protein [Thiotrichales bacterium]
MGISCQDYDRLEIAAMRRTELLLTLRIDENRVQKMRIVIQNLVVREGRELLITTDGDAWPLDSILTIEEMHPQSLQN